MVICRDIDLLSLVFARLRRHRAGAAIVFHGVKRPRVADVAGIITKRSIADAVIGQLRRLTSMDTRRPDPGTPHQRTSEQIY